ncbi:hypothetical protein ACFLU6_09080, partial [Acidobacteriota bacterium]
MNKMFYCMTIILVGVLLFSAWAFANQVLKNPLPANTLLLPPDSSINGPHPGYVVHPQTQQNTLEMLPGKKDSPTEASDAGPLGPQAAGDITAIHHDDMCFWLGMAIGGGGRWILTTSAVDPAPDRANFANGNRDYHAILWDPRQFTLGSNLVMIDTVSLGMSEAFVYDISTSQPYTFPEIMICPNIDNGSSDPADWEPDITAPIASTPFTPNFASDPGNNLESDWVEIPGLANTVVDASLPFWIVAHLPPGEVCGLPMDCGTTRNCPNFMDTGGVLQHRRSYRWKNLKVYSADDPVNPNQWLGPMTLSCAPLYPSHSVHVNGVCSIQFSDFQTGPPDDDELLLWNQSIIETIIQCAPDGLYNPKYTAPAPCSDFSKLEIDSDIAFFTNWLINGVTGVPRARVTWEIWNIDEDPNKINPPAVTIDGSWGYSNCSDMTSSPPLDDPTTWLTGGGNPLYLSTNPNAGPVTDRFVQEGHYEACISITHDHCDNTAFSPDPDGFPEDNFYNDQGLGFGDQVRPVLRIGAVRQAVTGQAAPVKGQRTGINGSQFKSKLRRTAGLLYPDTSGGSDAGRHITRELRIPRAEHPERGVFELLHVLEPEPRGLWRAEP